MISLVRQTLFFGRFEMLMAHIKENFRAAFYPRLSEWACALMIFNWGVVLHNKVGLMEQHESFRILLQLAYQDTWSTVGMVLGAFRLVVLLINGAWRRSPHLRGFTAFLCIFVWFQIVLSFSAIFGTGMATYPVILLMEMINLKRSFEDARLVDDAYRGSGNGQRSN